MDLAARHRFIPSYAIYEAGFIRLGAALANAIPTCPRPIYRFMFSDAFTFGFHPDAYALEAYLTLLDREAPESAWMIGGLGVDIRPLIAYAVSGGGHIRVGLEDAPFGTEMGNVDWVRSAVSLVEFAGERPATASEIRQSLASVP